MEKQVKSLFLYASCFTCLAARHKLDEGIRICTWGSLLTKIHYFTACTQVFKRSAVKIKQIGFSGRT
jgi:hypothetical protein